MIQQISRGCAKAIIDSALEGEAVNEEIERYLGNEI